MQKKTLFAVASGSGGHILPALIVARIWKEQQAEGVVVFCTGTSELDKKILSSCLFLSATKYFKIDKFIPKKVWLYPKIFFQVFWSFVKSFCLVFKHRPTIIISTGGLIAVPLCLAGRLLGSRIEVYELNVVPGKAVKLLMPLAHVIKTPFHATKKYCRVFGLDFGHKRQLCEYPTRFTAEDKRVGRSPLNPPEAALAGFDSSRKTIFLLGGSQGSLLLNNVLKSFLGGLERSALSSIQIIHQTGSLDNFDWTGFYKELSVPAITFSYCENVKDFYNMADLIICRAGAGTIFEVAFFGKPCIVIPLVASSTTHQVENAREIVKQYPHLFTMIEQSTLVSQPTVLCKTILEKLAV